MCEVIVDREIEDEHVSRVVANCGYHVLVGQVAVAVAVGGRALESGVSPWYVGGNRFAGEEVGGLVLVWAKGPLERTRELGASDV